MKRLLLLILVALALLPVPMPAEEEPKRQSRATLVLEYGLDSLERRYYHPLFRFDFPLAWGSVFSEVQYHSRMNGHLQGAIDYWVNVGVQKTISDKLQLELRLNHFCRHETGRDTPYVWNMNEVLARAGVGDKKFNLALGLGGFIGGSEGYHGLAVISGSWSGFIIPELSLSAEVKLVDFARIYHEVAVALALNRNIDLFIKNVRHYEYPNMTYFGLRYKSARDNDALLDCMKVQVGASPFHDVFKLEVSGDFTFAFFANPSRRVLLGIGFESPLLNGDSFFSQFWPGKMLYDIVLDYEKNLGSGLFAAWTTRYRLDMPVDDDLTFTASLFSGLALRNQPNFDELGKSARFEVCAGYDFKRGPAADCKLGVMLLRNDPLKLFFELRARGDGEMIRAYLRVMGSLGRSTRLRPYIGWKKDFPLDDSPAGQGKFLFGFCLFNKF